MRNNKRSERRRWGNLLIIAFLLFVAILLYLNWNQASVSTVHISRKTSVNYENNSTSVPSPQDQSNSANVPWLEDLPSFYIYDVFWRGEEMLSLQGECESSFPAEFCKALFEAKTRSLEKSEARLFLVPIFDSISDHRETTIDAIQRVRHDRYFLKFGGSNFVFVCYSKNCEAVVRDVRFALTKVNRSIWISRNSTADWPCENRIVHVENVSSMRTLVSGGARESYHLSRALEEAGQMIEGRNRWACEGRTHWGARIGHVFDFGTIRDTSFKSRDSKVAYCGVPKVGSSVAVLMMRRMNGMPDWKLENTVKIRNFRTGYKWRYVDQYSTYHMYDSTQWVKGMLVRNPVSRLLSGYRSKIEDLKEYYRIPGGWHHSRPPTFEEFIHAIAVKKKKGTLDWLDRHFRPQSALCGVRDLTYDFIGRYEDREQEIREFLESLELWDSIGATGWGANGTGSIYSQDEQIIRKNKPKPVTHADSRSTIQRYYTEDLIKTVMELYNEDFIRFGFSRNIDDYL